MLCISYFMVTEDKRPGNPGQTPFQLNSDAIMNQPVVQPGNTSMFQTVEIRERVKASCAFSPSLLPVGQKNKLVHLAQINRFLRRW
jgi:hypothetical protein